MPGPINNRCRQTSLVVVNMQQPTPAQMRRALFSRTLLRVNCWVCGNPVSAFLLYGDPPRRGRCPQCGAKPRNRAVHWYIRETLRPRLDATCELLEVGSSRVDARSLTSEAVTGPCRCTIVDLRALDFHAAIEAPHRFMPMDVTKLAFADASFDVILCNNTLPYIRDDHRALGEIFRCLKSDGLAMLDSHYVGETTRSVAEYRLDHPQLADGFFAENGDQWVYGRDYLARIEAAGFKTRTDVLFTDRSSTFKRRHGLKEQHALTVAFKSAKGKSRFAPTGGIRVEMPPGVCVE